MTTSSSFVYSLGNSLYWTDVEQNKWVPPQPQVKFKMALISQNDRLELFYKCAEFHAFTVKCTIQPIVDVSNWTTKGKYCYTNIVSLGL